MKYVGNSKKIEEADMEAWTPPADMLTTSLHDTVFCIMCKGIGEEPEFMGAYTSESEAETALIFFRQYAATSFNFYIKSR